MKILIALLILMPAISMSQVFVPNEVVNDRKVWNIEDIKPGTYIMSCLKSDITRLNMICYTFIGGVKTEVDSVYGIRLQITAEYTLVSIKDGYVSKFSSRSGLLDYLNRLSWAGYRLATDEEIISAVIHRRK